MEYPDYMTEREVSEYLKAKGLAITISTLQKKRTVGGGIPFVKHGNAVRYRKVDVQNYVESLQVVNSTSEVAA